MRALWMVLITVLASSALGKPAAALTAYAAGQGPVNSIEVGIEVRASVRDRCGFASGGAPSGSVDQPDFDLRGMSKDFALTLNCSGASRVAVSSRNGGMTTELAADGFASKAPYQVELRLVADSGASATATCDASALASGGSCAFSGVANTSSGLRLAAASTRSNGSYLRVKAPSYAAAPPLLAGRYADVLTITISAAP